jgi:hypothetical protein
VGAWNRNERIWLVLYLVIFLYIGRFGFLLPIADLEPYGFGQIRQPYFKILFLNQNWNYEKLLLLVLPTAPFVPSTIFTRILTKKRMS